METTPTLYGVILHWEAHEGADGEQFDATDHFFISPDAVEYLEVRDFPFCRDEEDAESYRTELRQMLDEGRPDSEGRMFKPMRYARRFFAQQETRPDTRVTFDSRLWPPLRTKPNDADSAGLPANVGYPNLGMTSKVAAS